MNQACHRRLFSRYYLEINLGIEYFTIGILWSYHRRFVNLSEYGMENSFEHRSFKKYNVEKEYFGEKIENDIIEEKGLVLRGK